MTFGNWFKTNIQNYNFSKFFTAFGQTAMNAGMTSAAIQGMNQRSSIFGGCCGGGYLSGGYYNQPNLFGGCCNSSMMYNPLGIGNCNNGNFFFNYNAQAGIDLAGQQGYLDGLAIRQQAAIAQAQAQAAAQQQASAKSLPKTNWQAADAISSDQNTEAGRELDRKTTEILKNRSGEATIVTDLTGDNADSNAKYKDQISELGKSYGASMDQNRDGYVTLDEYKAAENHRGAETAFKKMDMNGDGKLDWKELAATLRTLDIDTSNESSRDGKISYDELNRWQQLMVDGSNTTFDTAVRRSYLNLFKPDQKD